jgi:hypothetical protein
MATQNPRYEEAFKEIFSDFLVPKIMEAVESTGLQESAGRWFDEVCSPNTSFTLELHDG